MGSGEGLLLWVLLGSRDAVSLTVLLPLLTIATWISVGIATLAGNFYGNSDDSRIVIDEFIGYSWAGIWFRGSPLMLVLAFALFRFFDVFKPLGIRRLENLPKGWGCVLDDVASGIASACVLALVRSVL